MYLNMILLRVDRSVFIILNIQLFLYFISLNLVYLFQKISSSPVGTATDDGDMLSNLLGIDSRLIDNEIDQVLTSGDR